MGDDAETSWLPQQATRVVRSPSKGFRGHLSQTLPCALQRCWGAPEYCSSSSVPCSRRGSRWPREGSWTGAQPSRPSTASGGAGHGLRSQLEGCMLCSAQPKAGPAQIIFLNVSAMLARGPCSCHVSCVLGYSWRHDSAGICLACRFCSTAVRPYWNHYLQALSIFVYVMSTFAAVCILSARCCRSTAVRLKMHFCLACLVLISDATSLLLQGSLPANATCGRCSASEPIQQLTQPPQAALPAVYSCHGGGCLCQVAGTVRAGGAAASADPASPDADER